MATHDYNLANQDGASFRSDLNNALAAIVSNNSSSTAPATTFAHQLWVDTTANVIKQRNAANDAWVELWRIDGGFNAKTFNSNVTLNAQSDLRFADSDSSNWVAFQAPATVSSNVTWTLPSADGTADQALVTNGSGTLSWADAGGTADNITEGNTSAEVVDTGSDGHFKVVTEGAEALRVDASRRLLVGTSTARTNAPGGTEGFLVEGTSSTNSQNRFIQQVFGSSTTDGPYLGLGKTRSTTIGGNTVVQSDDELGGIYFQGADGSNFKQGASIISLVDGTPGANDMPGRLVFSTTADGASSPTERMRINASGNVGIGTSSPGHPLAVKTTTDGGQAIFDLDNADTGNFGGLRVHLGKTDRECRLEATYGSSFFAFYTNSSEGMRLDSSGRLLCNTTNPVYNGRLCVEENAASVRNVIAANNTAPNSNSVGFIAFYRNSTYTGGISNTGNTTAYNTSSDYRLKENVVALNGAIDRVKQLAPKRFNFTADAGTTVDGFLAHEVQGIVPEAITGTKDEVEVWKEGQELPDGVSIGDNKLDEDGNTIPVYQGIDQSKLVPLLTAALQEAIGKIEALETANASLEARLTALEGGA